MRSRGCGPHFFPALAQRFSGFCGAGNPKIVAVKKQGGSCGGGLSRKVDVIPDSMGTQAGIKNRRLFLPQQIHGCRHRLTFGQLIHIAHQSSGPPATLRSQHRTAHHMHADQIAGLRRQMGRKQFTGLVPLQEPPDRLKALHSHAVGLVIGCQRLMDVHPGGIMGQKQQAMVGPLFERMVQFNAAEARTGNGFDLRFLSPFVGSL
ncbi:MAG: hypothetical protein BWY83_01475 [bacterium ADurb.Bin478]|nr:MAG: hypothetical protein BWY83_01475 [bacterium ADurb.Bin478]